MKLEQGVVFGTGGSGMSHAAGQILQHRRVPFSAMLDRARGAFAAWQHRTRIYRKVMDELNGLDTDELNDLNIGRADFHDLASEAASST